MQFGGQTPLKLAVPLEKAGVQLLGTTADAIDRAEDRGRFDELLDEARAASARAAASRRGIDERVRDRRGDRLPGAGAPELRARRPRDDDRVHARRARARTCALAVEAAREPARRRS